MKKLVFATNNLNKLREVKQILGDKFDLLSLKDVNCMEDIPETADTLEGNAEQKADYVLKNYGYHSVGDYLRRSAHGGRVLNSFLLDVIDRIQPLGC